VSSNAVDHWGSVSAPHVDGDLAMLPKMFKAKTNDEAQAIALTKAALAEFFDFGDLQAQLNEMRDRAMLIEGEVSEEQIKAEAAKLAKNPAILVLARKRLEQRNEIAKRPRL